jgi:hypothetical protein
MELAGTTWLIKSTLQPFKPQFELFNVSFSKAFQDRGWIPASALGLLVVLLIVIASATSPSISHLHRYGGFIACKCRILSWWIDQC